MLVNLFGNYLVKKSLISEEQFKEIKESGARTRVKLGLIAVSEKLLTEKQAEEINRKQAVMDKRFGDIAVELGYLSFEQVSYLLNMQGNAYMVFCQSVTDKGFLSLNEVEEAFADFVKENNIPEDKISGIKADNLDDIVSLYLGDCDDRCKELISIVIRTINRLISTDISISKCQLVKEYKTGNISYQPMEGDFKVLTCLCGDDEGVVNFANIFASEEFSGVDEDTLDALGEFINIVNGLYATSLSYQKVSIELMPPVLSVAETTVAGNNLCVVPIMINGFDMKLIVSID